MNRHHQLLSSVRGAGGRGGGEDLSFQRFHLVKGNVMARDTHHSVERGRGEGGGLASGETMLQQGSRFF